MSVKKFVPSGCQLLCDKGSTPTPLTVTSNNSKIYGDKVATETDLKPWENIQPFGTCSLKNGAPCCFTPLYWDKCLSGVKIKGQKLIIDDAKLLCSQGGKISIFYSKADAMLAAGKESNTPGGSIAGVGITLEHILPYFNRVVSTDEMLLIENLHWSQSSASNFFSSGKPVAGLRNSIVRAGGNTQGIMPPLDVVRMEEGFFTSLDHRRGVAALDAGASKVPVRIHEANAPLPANEKVRFRVKTARAAKRLGVPRYSEPSTYGEAVKFRVLQVKTLIFR